jgi:predicted alpha/beta superfamily hydrolase
MYAQLPEVSSGKIERLENFRSTIVNPRNVDVWLPDGYTLDKKYAVLYMHDGQMLYDANATWNGQEWKVDEVVAGLLKDGKIRDCIVVGVWNDGDNRWSDYNPQKALAYIPGPIVDSAFKDKMFADPNADNYLKFLVGELKPFIDDKYSTHPERENTFVMGSSMGGLISMYAICEYPEVFGGAGCLSTHWVADPNRFYEEVPKAYIKYLSENLPDPSKHKIYFDFGTETLDQYYEPWQKMADEVMKEKGYSKKNWMTKKFPGEAHTEDAWAARLAIPLIFLMGK